MEVGEMRDTKWHDLLVGSCVNPFQTGAVRCQFAHSGADLFIARLVAFRYANDRNEPPSNSIELPSEPTRLLQPG